MEVHREEQKEIEVIYSTLLTLHTIKITHIYLQALDT
jgi:hypothetical protein